MKPVKELVSIVIPVYNAEKFLDDTIASVLNQTYSLWELVLVDDRSTDSSREIIESYQKEHGNIRLFSLPKNSGVAAARNKGILESQGRYIAFLDADDLWESNKLAEQILFMQSCQHAFTFTDYEFADANGVPTGKKVKMPTRINRKTALKETVIWTSTVMIDTQQVSKEYLQMPLIQYGEDAITWWRILSVVEYAYSINKVLSYYRRTPGTLSANKLHAAIKKWHLYRDAEQLPFFYSIYCYVSSMVWALRKRL